MAKSALLVLLGFFSLTGAQAGIFDDDVARKGLSDLETRIEKVKRTLEERLIDVETIVKGSALPDLLNQVEELKAELAKLRGQLEVASYEIEQTHKKQQDLYLDLDSRIRKLESFKEQQQKGLQEQQITAGSAGNPNAAISAPATPEKPSEEKIYETAYDAFKAGRYAEAVTGFQGFLQAYQKSILAASAQYWIGSAYYAVRDYQNAIQAQRKLIANYPDSQKVPDALFNIASSQAELGKNQDARKTLTDLITKYPSSEAAAKAKAQLNTKKKK